MIIYSDNNNSGESIPFTNYKSSDFFKNRSNHSQSVERVTSQRKISVKNANFLKLLGFKVNNKSVQYE